MRIEVNKYESFSRVLLNEGKLFLERGEHESAIKCFSKILNCLEVLHFKLGNNKKVRELENSKKAIECFSKLLDTSEYHKVAQDWLEKCYYKLGEYYYLSGNKGKTIEYLNKISEDSWCRKEKEYCLGVVHFELGNNKKAIECFSKLLDTSEYHKVAQDWLDKCHYKLGKYFLERGYLGDCTEAMKYFSKITKGTRYYELSLNHSKDYLVEQSAMFSCAEEEVPCLPLGGTTDIMEICDF